MNTLCGANTELSCCLTNLFNPNLGLVKFNARNLSTGLLPSLYNNSNKEVQARSRTNGIVLSISCSGTKNDVETAKGSRADGLTYKDAGVDIDAGSELVKRIAKMAPGIGGFGGLFPLGDSYLVAGTDGVGTKLKLAFETGIHETIGIDLVAMSVNDIVTSGAKPLFFLDYFATSHLDVDLAEKVIKGIVDGCQQSNCTLLGGETAEMPDFYAEGEYDLSGFAVGIVKKESVIDGKNITVGDVLLGLPSSGVHSNGFSLVRRVLKHSGLSLKNQLPCSSVTLGEALLAPTCIYVKQVLDIISKGGVKGIAHITGGGFTDNIPRVFPKGLGAVIYKDSWVVPPIFKWIQEAGRIEDSEMKRTFNMGIGMVLVVNKETALKILGDGHGTNTAYQIGEVIHGDGVRQTEISFHQNQLEQSRKWNLETPEAIPNQKVLGEAEATIPVATLSPPEGNTTFLGGTTWCIAHPLVPQFDLQIALDWACGSGQADCGPIRAGGPCFEPNTLVSHASFAFNSYYQQNGNNDIACNFGGTARLTQNNPSYEKCVYETSGPVKSSAPPLSSYKAKCIGWEFGVLILLFQYLRRCL